MHKAVFITGATAGTGFAVAERFAREGQAVYLTSRSGDRAREAAERLTARYGVHAGGYALDIRNEQAVIDVFNDIDARGGAVETVVLNAADLGFGTDPAKGMDLFSVPIAEFQRVLETNLVWNFMIVRQAALRMRTRGRGAIVFVGSNTAARAIPNRAAYCASKGGINALSKALAVDLGRFGIRCNVVLPGTIKTERWLQMGDKQIVDGALAPLGDISDYDDIAEAAYFLGSDAAKNITGAELVVDGGMSCQLFPEKLKEWKAAAAHQQEK